MCRCHINIDRYCLLDAKVYGSKICTDLSTLPKVSFETHLKIFNTAKIQTNDFMILVKFKNCVFAQNYSTIHIYEKVNLTSIYETTQHT